MADREKPLRKCAEAFKELETKLNSQAEEIEIGVAQFTHACTLLYPLLASLGIAFKLAKMDYVAKVEDLRGASSSIISLNSMINRDIELNSVKIIGSHSRNLLRVKRGLDMLRVLFEQILAIGSNSLEGPAITAYEQVFAPHHGLAVRKIFAAGVYALPTKAQLVKKFNENEASANAQMHNYIVAVAPLLMYIDKLFHSRHLGVDW